MSAVRSEVEELRDKISKLEVRLFFKIYIGPVLLTGRLFGRSTAVLQPNFCRFCTERAVKGPNFFSHARRHLKKIFISLKVLSSEMDPAEIRLIR